MKLFIQHEYFLRNWLPGDEKPEKTCYISAIMHNKIFFARDYLIHYYDVEPDHKLSLASLVHYFEDSSLLHCTALGQDLAWFAERNCGWMLLKWDITILDRPSFAQSVTVETWVNSIRRFESDREYLLKAQDGRVLAKGRSNWLFVDVIKRRPLRVLPEIREIFDASVDHVTVFVTIPEVLPVSTPSSALTSTDPELFEIPVWASERTIDTNLHVNNVCYLEWALDTLPHDFSKQHIPVSYRAQFKKELNRNATARSVACIEVTTESPGTLMTRHSIRDATDEFASLEITWHCLIST